MMELRNRKTGCENGTFRKHQTLSEPFNGTLQDFFLFGLNAVILGLLEFLIFGWKWTVK
jgi:hypothetical protein